MRGEGGTEGGRKGGKETAVGLGRGRRVKETERERGGGGRYCEMEVGRFSVCNSWNR